jgi:GntR family transcriptional repressor for pyruvate dehydrogenase complex
MAELQRAFAQQGLKAGERLPPERELARQLSVGRSSLREAMQGLQTMGLVEVRRGVGTFFASEPGKWLLSPLKFARTPSRRLLAELIEARLLVEVRLAERAAERATERDIARLRQTARARAAAGHGQYVERGVDFHLAIAAAAHHAVLASMLNAVFHLYFDVLASPSPAAPEARAAFRAGQQGGHDEILACIEARNPQGAGRAMQAHLRHLQRHLPFTTGTRRRPGRRPNRGGLDGQVSSAATHPR